jgi:hypothetical protein
MVEWKKESKGWPVLRASSSPNGWKLPLEPLNAKSPLLNHSSSRIPNPSPFLRN